MSTSFITANALAEAVGGGVAAGDPSVRITGISGLGGARAGDVSFLADPKHARFAAHTQASALILPEKMELPAGCKTAAVIRVADVHAAVKRAAELLAPLPEPEAPGIHPSAVIEDEVSIGDGAVVGAHVFIGRGVKIGTNCRLSAGVKILRGCELGNNVILHPGVVVGTDGFGYVLKGRSHEKIPQLGKVVIEDDVEIGANTTIDRARFGATRIGRGTKIDNLVMIAHNVQIGEHCIITAQCGIAGSSVIGDYVMLGAQAGVTDHVRIGDKAMVGAQAGVSKDVPPGGLVTGTPAQPWQSVRRVEAAARKLPDLVKRVKKLERGDND